MRRRKNGSKNKNKRTRLVMAELIAVAVLCVGGWGYMAIKNARAYVNEQNAIQINGEKFSVSDVNYFFYTYYESFREQNSEFLSYMFDDSKPLNEQEYEDGQTWFDYLLDESLESMIDVVTVASAAEEEGFEAGDESSEQIQEYLDGVTAAAENSEMTADEYMQQTYGQDMTLERYGELLTMSFTAKDYSLWKEEQTEVTEEDIEKEYEDNRDIYDYVDYERLYFKACDSDEEPDADQMEEARLLAEKALADVEEGASLEELSKESAYEGSVYFSTDEAYYSSAYAYGEWLFSDDREDGDSSVQEDEKGYYVMIFHSKSRHEYPAVSFYDIAFPIDSSAEDTNQEYEDSCTKAEEMLEKWESGQKTEDSFKELCEENTSEDEDSGGIYEDVLKDDLDSYVAEWCYDEERKSGDCEVIYSEEGFHVLYFSGTGETAWKKEAEENIREAALQDVLNQVTGSAEVKRSEKALARVASSLNEES